MRSDRESWDAAVLARGGSFLQSFEWGTLQEAFGRSVFRMHAHDFFAQCIEHQLPFGIRYWYLPRGPVGNRESAAPFFEILRRAGIKQRIAFLRIDPPASPVQQNAPSYEYGFRDAGRTIQPKQSLVVDLRQSEEAILAQMHEKTRYNIRVAERHGVECRIWKVEDSSIDAFFDLLEQTKARQGIQLHPPQYYKVMLKTISEIPHSTFHIPFLRLCRGFYIASYQGKPLAAAVVVYFGNRATYLHGGSTIEHKNVMAPYVLHWQMMRDAKNLGFTEYDFGGVDEARWPGLTRFKRGFGGRIEEYPNAYEFSLRPLQYRVYGLAKTFDARIRKLMR